MSSTPPWALWSSPLAAADALDFLYQCRKAMTTRALLVSGDLSSAVRGVNGRFIEGPEPSLALAGGGRTPTDDDLLDTFERLRTLVRNLAPDLGYAFAGFEATFQSFMTSSPVTEWVAMGGTRPEMIEYVCDEYVFDGFPWQVLGPGHLARLGGPPEGAAPVAEGRVELSVGQPSDWLLASPVYEPCRPEYWTGLSAHRRDPAVADHARALLRPCLLTPHERRQLGLPRSRWRRKTRPGEDATDAARSDPNAPSD